MRFLGTSTTFSRGRVYRNGVNRGREMIAREGIVLELEESQARVGGRWIQESSDDAWPRSALCVRHWPCGIEGTGAGYGERELTLRAFGLYTVVDLHASHRMRKGCFAVFIA